jgi:hypothetical protein
LENELAFLIVAEYDPLSAAGIERLKGLMPQDLTYERTWILLNKVLPEFAKNFSDFLEVVRYLSPIPWDSEVVRAYARRRLAIDVDNGNAFTLTIMQVVKVLFTGIEEEIDQWASARAEMIKRPIDEQYQDLEKEFASIVVESEKLKGRMNRKSRLLFWSQAISGVGVIALLGSNLLGINGFFPGILPSTTINVAVTLVIVGGLMSGIALSFSWIGGPSKRSPEAEIEKAKLDRRRVATEEQLRRLETLRAATLETLVRSKSANAR